MRQTISRLAAASGIAIGLSVGIAAASASATVTPAASAKVIAAHVAPAVIPDGLPTSGSFQIHNYHASGKCIGISGGFAGSWNCTTHPDQTWHWGAGCPLSGACGWVQLMNGNPNTCLSVSGSSLAEGARITAEACNTSRDDQYWEQVSSPVSGQSYLENYGSGYVIGVSGASTSNGAELVQWARNTNGDQYWSGG